MRKTGILLMMIGLAHGAAIAQSKDGRLQGSVGPHQFDVSVKCDVGQMGKTRMITVSTDANIRKPMEDTNGDGIAGQINVMGETVAVELAFGADVYRFGGKTAVKFRDDGFSWKDTMRDYDNEKMQTYLKTGKRLKDLEPERTYEIALDLSCK